VVFVSEPHSFFNALGKGEYLLEKFPSTVEFEVGFFHDPPVHRLNSLFQHNQGRIFVAYVGRNDDVNVVAANQLQFRWQKSYWTLIDRRIFETLLTDAPTNEAEANALISVLFAISDLRFGSLVLVAADPNHLPSPAGSIASSDASSALQNAIIGSRLSELLQSNTAIGVLTSDGLTTFDKDGVCLRAGEIIDLQVGGSRKVAGGGRTQAALTASYFGVAIKVSEDGPITVFRDGKELIRFAL
jgi:hypothetical protein